MAYCGQAILHSFASERRVPPVDDMDRVKIGNQQVAAILQGTSKFLESVSQVGYVAQHECAYQQIKLVRLEG